MDSRIVPVPVLALLTLIHRVEQIGTCLTELDVADGPKVGDRQRLFGRLRQEEVADGRVCRLGESLQLFERRELRSFFPLKQCREPGLQLARGPGGNALVPSSEGCR